jgi:hypothetical protein
MADDDLMIRLFGLHDFMVVTFGLMAAGLTTFMLEVYVVLPYGNGHSIPVIYQALMSIGFFILSYMIWVLLAKLTPKR